MNIENVEKKLREAFFFLGKMREQERRAFGDKEPFDFYLSAFLSATKSVCYLLSRVQGYGPWRKAWNSKRTTAESKLIDFLGRDRDNEVHGSGSRRKVKDRKD